jgi:hypothetical protein
MPMTAMRYTVVNGHRNPVRARVWLCLAGERRRQKLYDARMPPFSQATMATPFVVPKGARLTVTSVPPKVVALFRGEDICAMS